MCPGGGQRPQRQPAEVDLLSVMESPVLEDAVPGGGGQNLCPFGGELSAPRDEVGMQVGLGAVGDTEPSGGRGAQVRGRVAFGIDDQRPAVAEVDDVGGVPQAFVDHGEDEVGRAHRGFVPATTM